LDRAASSDLELAGYLLYAPRTSMGYIADTHGRESF
jgi:hypothetical protein